MSNAYHLTPQQARVLDLMCEGFENKQIAREMGISPRTVEIHRAHAIRCVGGKGSLHACLLWMAGRLTDATPLALSPLISATQQLHRLLEVEADPKSGVTRMSIGDARNALISAALRAFPAAAMVSTEALMDRVPAGAFAAQAEAH
jgi:DNA-binding CsgD family transcriptional regulator